MILLDVGWWVQEAQGPKFVQVPVGIELAAQTKLRAAKWFTLWNSVLKALRLAHFENNVSRNRIQLPEDILVHFPQRRSQQIVRAGSVWINRTELIICLDM